MIGLEHYLILSGILFSIGFFGALTKKNIITVLMSVELMFNAVNIAVVAFSKFIEPRASAGGSPSAADQVAQLLSGQIFAIFIITVAAAEVALGLALVIAIFRHRETVDISEVNTMKR